MSFADGIALFPATISIAGPACRQRAPPQAQPHYLFQRQPPLQPDKRLLRRLQILRLLSHTASGRRLHAQYRRQFAHRPGGSEEGATELHIVGGLNTKLPFSYFTDLLSALKKQYPQLHLKAFTMVELDHFAHFYKMEDEEVIQKLIEAGMDSCPGGGAEIFREPTRSMICAHKCDANRWLELSGKVHAAGLKTNATMLYGHIESIEDRVDHLIRLREQQDKSGGFQCFIPLAFYPPDTQLAHCPALRCRFAEDDGVPG